MADMEYHYQTIGRILAHLVNKGLARVDFDGASAMDIMTERRGSEEDILQTFADVVIWMRAEGLIRIGSIHELDHGAVFDNVQLTAKGVAVVQHKPEDPDLGDSIEKKVSRESELEATTYTKIGSFVGGLLGGAISSMS